MTSKTEFLSRFNFTALPFTREIGVKDRFVLDIYDGVIEHLRRAVNNRLSAVLVAPAGTGKTMVLRCLVARLPEARFRVHYIKVTGLSKRDLCREIAAAVGAESAGNYPSLVRRLQERFLQTCDIDRIRPVLIIDEGHDLRPDVLNILNILTNFEMDSRLVVSVVLAGQPSLSSLLQHKNHQDTAHRMAHLATLRTLSGQETTAYIKHRCLITGSSACPFDTDALTALFEIGRGNLRASDYLV
jgi:general secretion pathway protein A